MSVVTVDPYGPERGDTALWTVAALVVAAAHVGVVAAALLLRPAQDERAAAPAIDVAFMPATSMPAPAAPAAPDAQPAEPTPPVEQSEPTPPKDEPVTPREAVAEPEPAPPAVALTAPSRPEEPTAALPPPTPATKPLPEAKKPATIPERATHKPVKDEKAEKEKRRAAPPKPAAAPSSSPMRMASAPNRSTDSEGERAGQASWNNELAAHIRQYATYPASGGRDSGTVQVSVTIDRNGRLLSHRLAGSSGSPALDRAALAVIERAQPFPRFPPGMTQSQVARTIPLHLRPQ